MPLPLLGLFLPNRLNARPPHQPLLGSMLGRLDGIADQPQGCPERVGLARLRYGAGAVARMDISTINGENLRRIAADRLGVQPRIVLSGIPDQTTPARWIKVQYLFELLQLMLMVGFDELVLIESKIPSQPRAARNLV